MILEIFDKYTRKRIELIRIYNYVTYTNEFIDIGSFEIRIPIIEESLRYLVEGNYILLDEGVCGIIKRIQTSIDDSEEVIVSGYLTKHLLQYRSFLLTTIYYDYISNIAKQMVNDLLINPKDERRKINCISLPPNSEYDTLGETKIRVQNTGDELQTVLSEIMLPYDYGFDLYPVLNNFGEKDNSANISSFEFRIIKPKNRCVGNKDGNKPVVFSFELDNLNSILLENDSTNFKNVAIVAAEGEGVDRHIIEVGDVEASGLDRIELYVDARDLQPSDGVQIDDEKATTYTTYSSTKIEEKIQSGGGGGGTSDYNSLSNLPKLGGKVIKGDMTETDPTVPSYVKSITQANINSWNNKAETKNIPTKLSQLTNDKNFITTETDPTVPAWAKQPRKPTYTAEEVGALPSSTVISAISGKQDKLTPGDNVSIVDNVISFTGSSGDGIINDTQISESTTYSSQKIESILGDIDEILSEINGG